MAVIDENYIEKKEGGAGANSSTSSYVSVDADSFEMISSRDTY